MTIVFLHRIWAHNYLFIGIDNSGSISTREFGLLVYDLGFKLDETDLQAAVRALDKDHSGFVDA
jgi:Ca2+-binding EF-hand superfamily protein